MSKCENCRLRKESAKAFDIHWLGEDDCPYDKCPVPDFQKTNADRIRAMSDEELAAYYFTEFFRKVPYCHENCPAHDDCQMCLLDWLREEAEKDGAE